MDLTIGDKVKIRMAQGKLLKGVIKTVSIYKPKYGGLPNTTYGVELEGTTTVVYYREDELIKEQNPTVYLWQAECTCGAKSVGSKMHRDYCDLTHNKKFTGG